MLSGAVRQEMLSVGVSKFSVGSRRLDFSGLFPVEFLLNRFSSKERASTLTVSRGLDSVLNPDSFRALTKVRDSKDARKEFHHCEALLSALLTFVACFPSV